MNAGVDLQTGQLVVSKRHADRMDRGQKIGGNYHGYVLEGLNPKDPDVRVYLDILEKQGFKVDKKFRVSRDPQKWGGPEPQPR